MKRIIVGSAIIICLFAGVVAAGKISGMLTAEAPVGDDLTVIVDVSDTTQALTGAGTLILNLWATSEGSGSTQGQGKLVVEFVRKR